MDLKTEVAVPLLQSSAISIQGLNRYKDEGILNVPVFPVVEALKLVLLIKVMGKFSVNGQCSIKHLLNGYVI